MKISALFPCSIWQRQESRPRTTGQPAVTPMWVSSPTVTLVLVPSSCYCHEKRRSCEKAGWEAEESGKQTHMSFPVFSWMGSLLIESERIRAHTYKWCTHTHTPTQKHAWFRGRGAQRQEEKSRSCTMTFLTFCVALLKGSLLRLVELDSVTEP